MYTKSASEWTDFGNHLYRDNHLQCESIICTYKQYLYAQGDIRIAFDGIAIYVVKTRRKSIVEFDK